jgi:hypothetical protein
MLLRTFRLASALAYALAVPAASAALLPASGLQASAESSSSIRLTWKDPNGDETGLHVQRSTDGTTFSPIGNVGPNVTTYLDASVQLAPATLYYYRIVAFIAPSTDAAPSNVAAATTFPASAAKVCATQVSEYHAQARFPSVTHNGTQWAAAWAERSGGKNENIAFQLLDQTTGAPVGMPKLVTSTDSQSNTPTLRWNGTKFGLLFGANAHGADGVPIGGLRFALLDAAGDRLRGDVRVTGSDTTPTFNNDLETPLVWNGGSWGVFIPRTMNGPSDIAYYRLAENGDPIAGPIALTATPNDNELDVTAAWNGSVYGVAWIRWHDLSYSAYFQRVQADGTKLGSPSLLYAAPTGNQLYYSSVVADGSGFAIAFSEATADGAALFVRLARVDSSGVLLGAPQRISDDVDVDDETPKLVPKPGGGFFVLTSSVNTSATFDVAVLHADAGGARVGSATFLTADDGRHQFFTRVATDGASTLVVFDDNTTTLEVASLRLDSAGALASGPMALTSGHHNGNALGSQSSGMPSAVALGAGFAAAWTEPRPTASQIHAALVDGAGAITTKMPLTARSSLTRTALASAGSTFAIAFVDTTPAVYFQRFDASGTAVTGEILVSSTNVKGTKGIAMTFSGEAYGVVYYEGNHVTFQRVAPNGSLVGSKVTLATAGTGNPNNHAPLVEWTGTGWAILWKVDDLSPTLYYAFIDAAGSVVVPGLQVTFSSYGLGAFFFAWTGSQLGIVRADFLGLDPPSADVYYTPLGLDGFTLGPDTPIVSGPLFDGVFGWRWQGDRFKLIYASGDKDGLRELDVMTNGTTGAGRLLTVRQGAAGAAWNGAALGLVWQQIREVYFETDACLADATPPSCPTPSASYDGAAVNLSWTPASDAESGLWRYLVFRDGHLLAERFADAAAYADGGAPPGLRTYEVRAMNGAWLESSGCATVALSTLHGDANGDGALSVADVFYLINSLFAGGPAPLGFVDVNGDHAVSVGDVFYLINYLFAGGPPPV